MPRLPVLLLLLLLVAACLAGPLDRIKRDAGDKDNSRSKLVAFLLSLFLGGFGVDWFYLSIGNFVYIVVGIIKLLLISSGGLCCCVVSCDFFGVKEKCSAMMGPCRAVFAIALFVWWVVDWVRILLDSFDDGLGHPLTAW